MRKLKKEKKKYEEKDNLHKYTLRKVKEKKKVEEKKKIDMSKKE